MSGSGSLNKTGLGDLDLGGNITLGAGGTITSVANLNFGTSHAVGSLTLNAGSSVVATGQSSTGIGRLQIGYGGTGTLDLSGGTIVMRVLDSIASFRVGYIDTDGNAGHGTVNFSSGSITLDDSNATGGSYGVIVVGQGANSTGILNQSGGSVTGNGGAFEMGMSGATGTYAMTNQASVTLGIGSTIYVGDGLGGSGLLHVSDNSIFTSSSQVFVGTDSGTGTIQQDGAGSTVTFQSGLSAIFIGSDADSTGNYDLSAVLSISSRAWSNLGPTRPVPAI